MNFSTIFGSFTKRQIALTGALLICVIGIGDFFAGPQVSTSLFYIFPIVICSWHGSRLIGIVSAFLSAIVWFAAEYYAGLAYSHFLILYWNTMTRLATFFIIAYSISGYRAQMKIEEELADTDSLTGVLNSRAFYEKVEDEISRSKRFNRPFSLAYFDLDNFKYINDSLGHITGDHLLKKITEVMEQNTRRTDSVARLGGDEFAILFSEADGQAALEAAGKLQNFLLAAMQENKWPVTFSIGVVTFKDQPENSQQVIGYADNLMYSVKKSGKNRVAHSMFKKADPAVKFQRPDEGQERQHP